jgi:transcription elongation factor GreA
MVAKLRERAPALLEKPETPIWETDVILTTRRGLARRQEEFRVLRDVKIPANSDAIGSAAALGDLSENSEWEAALEDQRTLTTRATEMEAELKQARLLEEIVIPEDVVAPGTKVGYVDLDVDELRTTTLLGPWDVGQDDDEVISYRAPLAKGLLGRKVGEHSEITVPGGLHRVRIESIEPVQL